jgi:hypothetical protein
MSDRSDYIRCVTDPLEHTLRGRIQAERTARLAAEARAAELTEALADLLPGELIGESQDYEDWATVGITVTFGAVRRARSTLHPGDGG